MQTNKARERTCSVLDGQRQQRFGDVARDAVEGRVEPRVGVLLQTKAMQIGEVGQEEWTN
jgi:hypothetical protein